MSKLGLEKEEEPEIKLPTFVGSWRKLRNSRKTSSSVSSNMLRPLTMWIIINCEKLLMRWEYQTISYYFLRNLYVGQEATVRILYGTTDWFKIEKGIWQGCLLSPCLFKLNAWAHHEKCQAGWLTSWNQERQNHQLSQLCGWYYSNGRKWRGTKEPLEEGEGGEWNSWLKTEY